MTNNESTAVSNTALGKQILGGGLEFAHNHTTGTKMKHKQPKKEKLPHVLKG
jgi:hypothetical protein